MSGRGDGDEADAADLEGLAIKEGAIRSQPPIAVARQRVDLEQPRRSAQSMRTGEPQGRTGRCAQGVYPGRMVLVRMGQYNGFDRSPTNGRKQGVPVRRIIGPRIEHRDAIAPHDKAVGAGEGEWSGIGCSDPHHVFEHGHGAAPVGIEGGIEGQWGRGVGHCTQKGERLETGSISAPERR